MRVRLAYKKNGQNVWYRVHNTFTMDERLDEEIDGGACEIITKTEDEIANFSLMTVTFEDRYDLRFIPFFAFDDVEKRAKDYYKHNVELIEPTRWLMGLTIDGLKVTQPIGTATKKTLYDVLIRVLKCFNTQSRTMKDGAYEPIGTRVFMVDIQTQDMLSSIVSPEFVWNPGTLLFEALQDMADVVNCIPRLTASEAVDRNDFIVAFDRVNDVTAEFEL